MSPGQRGDFKVTVDGAIRWDKKNREHEFPDEASFVDSLRR
jgi:predicted Rdx family selenoprotein